MTETGRVAGATWESLPVIRWSGGGDDAGVLSSPHRADAERSDAVAEETPVALSFNGVSHVVMMMTPADLEDFALGFCLSEAIVEQVSEVRDIEVIGRERGLELAVSLPPARDAALRQMRRNLTGRTGCGLCGAESLEQAIREVPGVPGGLEVTATAIERALAALPSLQPLTAATGAAHGAAWCDVRGGILAVREDVGRHNALDKLIGALAREAVAPCSGFALVSSRASYEMVTKAARAGIQLLVAVSAPTTLAVRLAQQAGLTLVAFARPGRLSVYSVAQRVVH